MWGILARRVYADRNQFEDIGSLKNAILREWENLPQSDINKLVQSMPNRIFRLINANGKFLS